MPYRARIVRIEDVGMAVPPPLRILTLEVDSAYPFIAGQYLFVQHPDGTAIPLSIASAPELLPCMELHYRSTPGVPEAQRMDELLESGSGLTLSEPEGTVMLPMGDDRPLVLIAGGTGVSQSLGLARSQSRRNPQVPIELVALADDERDFYFRDLLAGLPGVTATLIADPQRNRTNRGLSWLRQQAPTFEPQARIILSGSPGFVWAITDLLTQSGVEHGRLESDVYDWAPRADS